jgi:hypothetical protein
MVEAPSPEVSAACLIVRNFSTAAICTESRGLPFHRFSHCRFDDRFNDRGRRLGQIHGRLIHRGLNCPRPPEPLSRGERELNLVNLTQLFPGFVTKGRKLFGVVDRETPQVDILTRRLFFSRFYTIFSEQY